MHRVVKNTLLDYISDDFAVESTVNEQRIFEFNKKPEKDGPIVYLMERELRVEDNFALNFAQKKAEETGKKLKIIHIKQSYETELKQNFYNTQIEELQENLKNHGFEFEIRNDLKNISPGLLIIDFNPIADRSGLASFDCKIIEIDSHNIVPARYVSDKQEYNAATLRRKLYYKISDFLTEFPKTQPPHKITNARMSLDDFINNRLDLYAEYKNNPLKDVTSGLSKYLNSGYLSAQRAALEVIKSGTSKENKESYLEELIIRDELSDNFCLYCSDYKSFKCIPQWAKETLKKHSRDLRPYIYSQEELETAKTGDNLWNFSQKQLLETGKIHGYLRMYWAKKILEWTESPSEALRIAIYLNDKYALDAPAPNGYVGILWSIGALHDRAFAERPVTGKIRRMSGKGIKLD